MKIKYLLIIILLAAFLANNFYSKKTNQLPVIAIANYGPHSSLNDTITGIKEQLEKEGYVEGKNVHYEIKDVSFDPGLISQMLLSLKAKNPKLMIVMTTPIAQAAKAKIRDIPLIYSVITDPIEAGLIKEKYQPHENMTGSSDMQDIESVLKFAKSILPSAKRVGLLYATSESNDIALKNMMELSAAKFGMKVIAVQIEQARDVQIRMQEFNNKVDFIYVGTSGPVQPTLPVIAAEARKMHIPILNADAQAVKDGLALASFGVNYIAVGENTGRLAAATLNGVNIKEIKPIYPSIDNHIQLINKKLANEYGIDISANMNIVE